MNRGFLLFIQFHSFVLLFHASVSAQEPLLFNPHTLKIFALPDSPDVIIEGTFLLACPVQDQLRQKTTKKQSLDGKALFVQNFPIRSKILRGNIEMCDKNYEMSAVFNRASGDPPRIEFGYEIYSYKGKLPGNMLLEFPYYNYGPISEVHSPKKLDKFRHDYSRESKEDLDFLWISKIKARIAPSSWSLIRGKYMIYRNTARQLAVKCTNHNLGMKFYKKQKSLDEFYANQRNIFKLVQLSSLELPDESICQSTFECVKKYDLIPPYRYQTHRASSIVSCSNLTTIPIWYEVTEKLLDYLEKFLIAMSQETEHKLQIVPGTYDILSLPSTGPKSEPIQMYLNGKKKKIPIPKIIYKIVGYQSYNCDGKNTLCWFIAVIVIHNHPKVTKEDLLCPEDKCEEWGWDNIQYMNVNKSGMKSEHIYCCKLDEEMRRKLDYGLGGLLNGDLSLQRFPRKLDGNTADENNDYNRYEKKQKIFEDRMEKLETEIAQISQSYIPDSSSSAE